MVYRAESPKRAKRKKTALGGFNLNQPPTFPGATYKKGAAGSSAGRKNDAFGSGFGGTLNDIFGQVSQAASGAANQAQALSHPQRVAPQVTMQRKPKAKPNAATGQPDMIDSVLQSMLNDSASQSFDYESALKDAVQGIRSAYGAEIAAIRSNNKAARRSTAKARKETEAMFNGLARTYGADATNATKQGNTDAQGMLNLANQANANLDASVQKTTGQEAQMLKDLGQQETADQIIKPDYEKLRQAAADITKHGHAKAATAKEMAAADAQFFTRGGAAAQFEGAGRSADLLAGLQDYLRQNNNQIGVLKGKQAQDVGKTKSDLKASMADAQAKADSQLWDRMMQYANFKKSVEDTNFDNQLSANRFQYQQQKDATDAKLKAASQGKSSSYLPKGIQDAMGIIGTQGAQKSKLTSALQSLFNTEQFRLNQTSRKGGKTYKLTKYEAARLAEQAGRKSGLSEQDVRVLRLAAMASLDN